MKKLSALVGALVLFGSQITLAEEAGGYLGAQYAQTTYEQSGSGFDGEADPKAIVFVGGYKFNENVALEGRVGFGSGDDQYTTGTNIELDKLISVLGKFSLGGSVSPYLLVGFSDVEFDSNNTGTAEGNGVSFGAGIDINVSENTTIGLEYISYVDDDDDANGGGSAEATAVSLGVNFHF